MRNKIIAAIFILCPSFLYAQTPLSAIDWLAGNPPVHLGDPAPQWPIGEITVKQLDAPSLDAAGILPQQMTGFPNDLWKTSASADIIAQLETLPAPKLPALQGLLYTLLLAEASAPSGGTDGAFLYARIDLLARMGAVDPALGLAQLPSRATPQLQKRQLDFALLLDPIGATCPSNFNSWADYSTVIFCTARLGEWQNAELIFATAQSLDLLPAQKIPLLAAFLDLPGPDIWPHSPSAQDAAMAQTIGQPYPTAALALPFAHADLSGNAGWKVAILAAERLVKSGAIDSNQLWGIYAAQTPSASGGVWDRVKAFHDYKTALSNQNETDILNAIRTLWPLMRAEGLDIAFAQLAAPILQSGIQTTPITPEVLEIFIAAGSPIAPDWIASDSTFQFAHAVLSGKAAWAKPKTQLEKRIRNGFISGLTPGQDSYLQTGQFGAALLTAIADIETGWANQSEQLSDGLATLRLLGLDHVARATSAQILLRFKP